MIRDVLKVFMFKKIILQIKFALFAASFNISLQISVNNIENENKWIFESNIDDFSLVKMLKK